MKLRNLISVALLLNNHYFLIRVYQVKKFVFGFVVDGLWKHFRIKNLKMTTEKSLCAKRFLFNSQFKQEM